jgi:hypothetical protein
MSKVITLGTLVVLAVALVALPTYANLVATTFGFPVIVQNGSTCAFNQDFASAIDNEAIDINFPAFDQANVFGPINAAGGAVGDGIINVGAGGTANVLPFGPVNLAFPSISQTVDQTQTVSHCDFAQTNEFAEFAYPFVGVGGVSLPGFGFGW